MRNLPNVFATTIQKSIGWLHEVETQTGWDEQRAYRALRAALHALRDRLTVDQAAHLGAQLPMMVRGFYYEGWHPAGVPNKDIARKEDFLASVGRRANDPGIDPEQAIRAVFDVMARHITAGEMNKVRQQLPKTIASLIPDGAAHAEPPAQPADFIAGSDGIRPVPH